MVSSPHHPNRSQVMVQSLIYREMNSGPWWWGHWQRLEPPLWQSWGLNPCQLGTKAPALHQDAIILFTLRRKRNRKKDTLSSCIPATCRGAVQGTPHATLQGWLWEEGQGVRGLKSLSLSSLGCRIGSVGQDWTHRKLCWKEEIQRFSNHS
jgi:hypothetical protein